MHIPLLTPGAKICSRERSERVFVRPLRCTPQLRGAVYARAHNGAMSPTRRSLSPSVCHYLHALPHVVTRSQHETPHHRRVHHLTLSPLRAGRATQLHAEGGRGQHEAADQAPHWRCLQPQGVAFVGLHNSPTTHPPSCALCLATDGVHPQLQVSDTATLDDVQRNLPIPVAGQQLFFKGKLLKPEMRVSVCTST